MYLDDGVSRSSAPSNLLADTTRAHVLACKSHAHGPSSTTGKISSLLTGGKFSTSDEQVKEGLQDDQGKDEYTHIRVAQAWQKQPPGIKKVGSRTVTLEVVHKGYDEASMKKDIGDVITVCLWHAVDVDVGTVKVDVQGTDPNVQADEKLRCTKVVVPVGLGSAGKVEIKCDFGYKAK